MGMPKMRGCPKRCDTGFIVGNLVGNDNRTEWMANQMVVCTSVHNYFAYRYLPPILMLIACLEGCTRIYVFNDHMQGHKRPHAFPSFV